MVLAELPHLERVAFELVINFEEFVRYVVLLMAREGSVFTPMTGSEDDAGPSTILVVRISVP